MTVALACGMKTLEIVVTDFGAVRLHAKALAYMASIDPDWRAVVPNRRRWGRHARYVREQLRRIEDAVSITARIEWQAGDTLAVYP
jgi:hypothetical protein